MKKIMIMQDYLIGLNDTFLLIITDAILTRDDDSTTLTNTKGEILLLVNNDIIDFILKYNGGTQLPEQLTNHYLITQVNTDNYIK